MIRVDRPIARSDKERGIKVYIGFTNNSRKIIKNVTFGVSFFDKYGNLVRSGYNFKSVNEYKYLGPVKPGKGLEGYSFFGVWYHDSTKTSA